MKLHERPVSSTQKRAWFCDSCGTPQPHDRESARHALAALLEARERACFGLPAALDRDHRGYYYAIDFLERALDVISIGVWSEGRQTEEIVAAFDLAIGGCRFVIGPEPTGNKPGGGE